MAGIFSKAAGKVENRMKFALQPPFILRQKPSNILDKRLTGNDNLSGSIFECILNKKRFDTSDLPQDYLLV
jgi:hypothetical protein